MGGRKIWLTIQMSEKVMIQTIVDFFPHSELLPSIYETEIVVTKKFVDKT